MGNFFRELNLFAPPGRRAGATRPPLLLPCRPGRRDCSGGHASGADPHSGPTQKPCVLQEKRQGKRLPLHNIAPSRQHLGDATHFSEGAAVKGAGNNSGRYDSSAGVFSWCPWRRCQKPGYWHPLFETGTKTSVLQGANVRAKARRCCVSDWWQPSDPQGLSRPLGVKFGPVGRRGRPTSTPPLALEEDVPQSSRFLTQGTQAFGSFGSSKESALPHRSKASKVVGPLGLRPKEAPGHGPVNASSTGVLLRNPVIGRMLQPAC